MLIQVIDSFDTMNPPNLPDIPPVDMLGDDLKDVAKSIISVCKIKLSESGEGIDLPALKEIVKIATDVQKAFFDNKQTNVQVNNIQNNISNTQLNYFKGIMKNEI